MIGALLRRRTDKMPSPLNWGWTEPDIGSLSGQLCHQSMKPVMSLVVANVNRIVPLVYVLKRVLNAQNYAYVEPNVTISELEFSCAIFGSIVIDYYVNVINSFKMNNIFFILFGP